MLTSSSRHPFSEPLKHERPPDPGIYVDGRPVLVLPRGTKRERGKTALIEHVEIINAILGLVQPCFGPHGTYKLISAESGASFLTNDAFTIFTRVSLEHPLAQFVAGAGVDAARESGGGSATTIILTARMLSGLLPLVKLGVKQSVLVRGCIMALDRLRARRLEFSFADTDPISSIRPLVRTMLAGTLLGDQSSTFEGIVIEALRYTRAYEVGELRRLDDIYVRTQVGGSLGESRTVRGLALLRESIHPAPIEHLRHGKVLLVKGEFNMPRKGRTQYDHTLEINSPSDYATMLRSKHDVLVDVMGNVLNCCANVLLVEKGVDDMAVDYLAKRGIVVIRRFPPQEFDHIISVTGTRPVSDFNDAGPSDTVDVERVDFLKVAGSTWWFLEGFPDSRSCEIFVRGPDELALKEAERLLKSCLKVIRLYLQEPRQVYGGGWYEMQLARDLRKYARKIARREQLVIEKVAEAFESIPAILAESSGLDPLRATLELRRLSAEGDGKFYGVGGSEKRLADVKAAGIIEPLHVKTQSINSAFEAAITVLRVDDVILSRKLSKEEQYYLERLEKTTPDATRKIYRDYGI